MWIWYLEWKLTFVALTSVKLLFYGSESNVMSGLEYNMFVSRQHFLHTGNRLHNSGLWRESWSL
jgi:hypothetical protein